MRIVKAAAVQLSPVLYSREGTVDKVVRKIHELGYEGVQFTTFPETVVPSAIRVRRLQGIDEDFRVAQPQPPSVAAARICGNQHGRRVGIRLHRMF